MCQSKTTGTHKEKKMSDVYQSHYLHQIHDRVQEQSGKSHEEYYPYLYETWGQWLTLTVLLTSFGALIANTGNDSQLSTFLVVLGLIVLIWSTPFYFINRWGKVNSWMLLGSFLIVLLLATGCIWTIVHIQNKSYDLEDEVETKKTRKKFRSRATNIDEKDH